MSSRLYPEAIRGTWFMIPQEADTAAPHAQRGYDLLSFWLDDTFAHFHFKGGQLKQTLYGEYTFDGEFLITRPRASETYRVQTPHLTRWLIETPKGMHVMRRALRAVGTVDLTADQHKELRILPIKAKPQPLIDHPKTPYLLTLDTPATTIELAVVSRDPSQSGARWFGIAPLVEGIEERTWRRIIEESLLPTIEGADASAPIELAFLREAP